MKKQRILGMPITCAIGVIAFCLIGIIIGSFKDFQISTALANKTKIGTLFANYGPFFSFCLYPAAGMCLFKGLRSKGKKWNKLAWGLLLLSYFIAVYFTNSYCGKYLREAFGYPAGSSIPAFVLVGCYLLWIVLFAWIPPLMYKVLDDKNSNLLIAIGAIILIAGITSDIVNVWLKQVGSRPRFKYLLTLDDPQASFKNWWQMVPYFAGSNDYFKSWPSGNMTIATMMFSLPLFVDVLKNKNEKIRWILFIFACLWVIIYGYNRIHMTAHFLTDVCFGTLITYIIHSICSIIAIRKEDE